MTYAPSVFESLSKALSPVIRKLADVSTILLGQQVKMIRIYTIADDVNDDGLDDLLGDSVNVYESQVVDNVRIQLPASEVELFPSKDTSDQTASAISIMDFLPITIHIAFEGTQESSTVDLDENDLLVAIMYDYKYTPIPIILQSPKQVSSFYGKYEVSRRYECTLYRETLEPSIQIHVDNYIDSLGTPAVEEVYPTSGTLSYPTSGNLVIQFNTSMDDTTTNAITISPSISVATSWDLYSGQLTLDPVTNFTSGTLYTVTIDETAESMGGIPMEDDYAWNFTTEP